MPFELRQLSKAERYAVYHRLARQSVGQTVEIVPRVRGAPFVDLHDAWMIHGRVQWQPEKKCYIIGLNPSLILRGEVETLAHELAHILAHDTAKLARPLTPEQVRTWREYLRSTAGQQRTAQAEDAAERTANQLLTGWRASGIVW